jgi:hypothetical protein
MYRHWLGERQECHLELMAGEQDVAVPNDGTCLSRSFHHVWHARRIPNPNTFVVPCDYSKHLHDGGQDPPQTLFFLGQKKARVVPFLAH